MAEIIPSSLDQLTDERLQAVLSDVSEKDREKIDRILDNCPEGFRRMLNCCIEAWNENPGVESLSAAVLVCFTTGWMAREALLETEELERMAR